MPGMAGSHENWGNFKCHKWGELLRHSQEDVTADGGVGGMEDRPGAHDRLGPAKEVLDKEQIAVAQDRLERSYPGVGAQDEDPVETRLFGELAGVDLE